MNNYYGQISFNIYINEYLINQFQFKIKIKINSTISYYVGNTLNIT